MLKFLIVGFGSIGKRHFDNLMQIEDVTVSVLTRRHFDLPDTKVYSSIEETLHEHFDGVFITNETTLHIPTAIAFAERKYNLFIEKPISHSLEDIDKLANLISMYNLKVMVGCNMRFHPVIRLVKDRVQEGKIGRIISSRIEAGEYLPDWRPWQDYRNSYSAKKAGGGGAILDLIHELDYAYWFFGEASKIFSFSGRRSDLEIETEDMAEILIEFQNGTLCEVHLDYIQRPPGRNFKLIGTTGTIYADLITNEIKIFDVSKGDWETIDLNGNFERNKMYIDEVKHFIDYIQGRIAEPLIGWRGGVKVLQIARAAKESSRGGEIVEISHTRGDFK